MQTPSECFGKGGDCLLLKCCLVVRDVHSCWTETHTACQTGLTWLCSQSCYLGSLGNKISYFRFQQHSGGWIKTVLPVWWNNTSREMASNIQPLWPESLIPHCSRFFLLKGGHYKHVCCIASFLDIKSHVNQSSDFAFSCVEADLSLMKVYWMLLYGFLVGVAQHLSIRSIRLEGTCNKEASV